LPAARPRRPCAAQAGTESAGITINLNLLSQGNCRFTSLPPALMDFGVLDLASTVPISLSVPAIMECKGAAPVATYAVTLGVGLHHDGSTRTVTATIPVASLQQAPAGLYSDTITITVQP
jgi:spore coat protein U-like protein